MSTVKMTEARLLELIAAYGSDVRMFPEADREAASALLEAQPERFAAALADATHMDGLLATLPELDTPTALRAALIASAPTPRKQAARSFKWRFPVWVPAGAVASLAVGLFAGMSMAQPVTTQDDQAESLVYAALGWDDYLIDIDTDEVTQ